MKRYVLPAFKVLIALVIAVALVKVAFFPSNGNSKAADIQGTFNATTQTVAATVGDIANTVDVKGQIVEDATVPAQSTMAGKVEAVSVEKGTAVDKGATLLTVVRTQPQEPIWILKANHRYQCDETSEKYSDPAALKRDCEQAEQPDKVLERVTITAPIAGTVTVSVLKGQEVSIGDTVATVAPGTYSAVGTITPSQQYQLINAPTQAQLTIDGGPAPFTCEGLTIGTKANTTTTTTDTGSSTTTTGDGTSVEVRCPVPADQKVFPGLPVTIGIDAGSATDAVLVPVTAVEGSSTTGNVWVVTDPQNPDAAEKKEIKLGISDGTNVQVTEGLSEGDEILMFVPGKDVVRTGPPNSCDQYACYDENGQEYQ